ncbi:MAG: hypothetical protein IBX47_12980 [Desulfuromonadales bacterium]|nr:hypothetical protein [Desulfuromonadales bacterium]
MKDRKLSQRRVWQTKALHIFTIFCLLLAGCTTKTPFIFFPEEPAPPRVQLLTSFNDQGSLQNNKTLSLLIGETVGGGLSKGYGLAFHNGQLYVADSGKASQGIAVVDFEQRTIDYFKDRLRKPFNIAIDTDGTLYTGDLGEEINPSIVVFDAQHNYLKQFSFSRESGIRPLGLLIDGDNLFISGSTNNEIQVLNKNTGEIIRTIATDPPLGMPIHLSKTPEGNILVTETLAASLRLLSPSGEILKPIGSRGARAGNFVRPKSTAVDRSGNIYAVDIAFQNVQIFNSEGQPLMNFGIVGGNQQTLVMPAGIAITYDRMDIFQKYAAPDFILEYVIAVSSQGSPNAGSKITLYGFGKKVGIDYTAPIPDTK